jgi:hypothetical protein
LVLDFFTVTPSTIVAHEYGSEEVKTSVPETKENAQHKQMIRNDQVQIDGKIGEIQNYSPPIIKSYEIEQDPLHGLHNSVIKWRRRTQPCRYSTQYMLRNMYMLDVHRLQQKVAKNGKIK